MKYIYIYNNNSMCSIDTLTENDYLNNNYITHSKIVSQKTVSKEKGNNKYLHLFEKHRKNGYDIWNYYASYCI